MTNEEAEFAIRKIWRKLLHVDEIRGETSFFEVGGDSLLGAALIESIAEMAGVELDIMDLFENPTLADQAALVARNGA